jgi:hypothetical protein
MRLKSLTYTSRARLDLSERELCDIHETARHLNALDGVTGLLIFDGARFLQIVEGSEEAVASLLERLRRDERHTSVEVRDERFVEARSFPDWSMELARLGAGAADREIEAILPEQTAPAVRELALRMAGEMSGSAEKNVR